MKEPDARIRWNPRRNPYEVYCIILVGNEGKWWNYLGKHWCHSLGSPFESYLQKYAGDKLCLICSVHISSQHGYLRHIITQNFQTPSPWIRLKQQIHSVQR